MSAKELKPAELRAVCDPRKFSFQTTEELPELKGFVNQERATQGLELGISFTDKSFHVACVLAGGKSRTSALVEEIKRIAKERLNPNNIKDWVYVFNFDDPKRPILISLPPGEARKFSKAMERFRKEFENFLPEEMNSEVRQAKRIAILEKAYVELIEPFNARFAARKVDGIYFQFEWDFEKGWNPNSGNPIALPKFEEEKRVAEVGNDFKVIREYLIEKVKLLSPEKQEEFRVLERDFQREVSVVNKKAHEMIFEEIFEAEKLFTKEIFDKYAKRSGLNGYTVECWRRYIIPFREFVSENFSYFMPSQQGGPFGAQKVDTSVFFSVNAAVDNGVSKDLIPVIYEDEPTFRRLFGNAGDVSLRYGGAEVSVDHRNLTCGSLHKANGGVLIIPLMHLLKDPTALLTWETLCRALRSKKLAPRGLGDYVYNSFIAASPLKPEEMSISTRVVLLVDEELDFIFSYNSFFSDGYNLFRSRAEFVPDVLRDDSHEMEVAQFLGNCARKEQALHCDREAVALFVEYASRLADDQIKISLDGFSEIKDIFLQAVYWARERDNCAKIVAKEDVARALEEMIYRSNAVSERISEFIKDGVLKVDVLGERVGVINALAVVGLPSGYSFGKPSRVSATVRPGNGRIINVEGLTKLGGKLQKKSVEIAEGFLAQYLGDDALLMYEARIVFEQNYGGIEGDSASLAEIFPILSCLSGIPIKQSVAVTGSCNQLGEVQAIGGVNEKVEGFFDVCRAKDTLTGEQGVVIPADNVRHLMLREDVTRAVENGEFHVWAIKTVGEGIKVLMGAEEHELKNKAIEKLISFAEKVKEFEGNASDKGLDDDSDSDD